MKIFITKIENKITGDSIKNAIDGLKDGKYEIEFTELDTRSLQQNAFLFGWIYKQAIQLWFDNGTQLTEEQIHEYYKYQFLRKKKKCLITKRYKWKDGSTAKLSKKAFTEYIKKIDNDLIQRFGIGIPAHDYNDFTI